MPDQDADVTNDVISIHGLWMPGLEMSLLRRRLDEDHGFSARQFSYSSVSGGLDENIEALRRFIDDSVPEQAHIVAHSLGGVMALHTLKRYPDVPIDRVVCLGSPLVDSAPARFLQRYDWGRIIVGRTLAEGVLDDPLEEWAGPQSVGVIAGTVSAGIGMLVTQLDEPNDGVVSSQETRLPGITDHLEMSVNHVGLVLSSHVTEQIAHFLRDGCFATA